MATSDERHLDPVRARTPDTILVPPQLPPFLATVFDLQPITGVPNNEEVKLVHAAIRALNSFLHSSELRESLVDLSMELSQHLYDVQMACHREKYAVGIFPNDIRYSPPILPPHIPITLEPVVGPPSDDELRSAHAALRVSDSLLSVPSLPHLDLNMQLSQHLFDLQFARHIQRLNWPQPTANRSMPQRRIDTITGPPDPNAPNRPEAINTVIAENQLGTNISEDRTRGVAGSTHAQHPDTTQQNEPSMAQGFEGAHGSEEGIKLLVEMAETLKNINRVLIGSQHSLARGFNSASSFGNCGFDLGTHSLINEKGETPEMDGLPASKYSGSRGTGSRPNLKLNKALLPQYLRFYGIGAEMLEEGEELRIKEGMEEAAKTLVSKHAHTPVALV